MKRRLLAALALAAMLVGLGAVLTPGHAANKHYSELVVVGEYSGNATAVPAPFGPVYLFAGVRCTQDPATNTSEWGYGAVVWYGESTTGVVTRGPDGSRYQPVVNNVAVGCPQGGPFHSYSR
jgi:hypothetical protein